MSLIRLCEACGEQIKPQVGGLNEESLVQAAVSLDEKFEYGPAPRDYHRKCARTITLAQVWERAGLILL